MSERVERAKSTIKGFVSHEASEQQQSGAVTAPLGTPENPSNAIFTVANIITFCRFILTFVFLFVFAQNDPSSRGTALWCYAIAAITDFLDGQIARRTQTVSWLGKVMDPIMDRVLLVTGVLGLVAVGELPVWIAVFVIVRDLYLTGAAMRLRRYTKRPLDIIYIGKIATAFLMFGFSFMLLAIPVVPGLGITDVSWLPGFNHEPVAAGIFLVYAGIICSSIAVVIYQRRGLAERDRILAEKASSED